MIHPKALDLETSSQQPPVKPDSENKLDILTWKICSTSQHMDTKDKEDTET